MRKIRQRGRGWSGCRAEGRGRRVGRICRHTGNRRGASRGVRPSVHRLC